MKKILLVEDDQALGYVTRDNLVQEGFEIVLIADGQEGLDRAVQDQFDLIILDVMLPKVDGFTIAQKIREVNTEVPILFLSAKSLVDDRLEGLRSGGDDYLTKPFSMEELLLKVEVFLRRSNNSHNKSEYRIGKYVFDPDNLSLSDGKKDVKLTGKEAQLLSMLCEKVGMVIKREEILTAIWGNNDYFLGRSMDVFISKLRKYLRSDPRIKIENYHGVGFKLEVSDEP